SGSEEKLQEILTLLEKYDLKDEAIIISFKEQMIKTVRSLDEDIELWYLCEEITDYEVSSAKENNFAVAFNSKKNDDEAIKKAGKENVKLCAWTVDELDELERLYNCGVKYITTNSIIPEQ
ncbi:MAG: glycerophosphodiester phosphodiesterase, partial [Clostridia bacterium]|nr:glycerophosphodiester phosphodiesterase [Clostridia bacterium]